MFNLKFILAEPSHIPVLVELINSAYRQQEGNSWTSELGIVSGDRIASHQIEKSLAQDNFKLFVVESNGQFVACIGLTFGSVDVEIGTFCIAPQFQNRGVGRQVLDFAEQYVIEKHTSIKFLVMWVLSVRHELIAYYERRGYVLTGAVDEYPLDADVGIPQVDLHLVEMKKYFSQ